MTPYVTPGRAARGLVGAPHGNYRRTIACTLVRHTRKGVNVKWLLVAIAFLVSGCVTPEQAAFNRQQEAEREQQERAAYRERLAQSCDGIGFKRGTDAHANCILSQHQQNQARIMQLLPYVIQEQQQQEAARQRALKPYTPPPEYRTNCTRDYFGNVNCTTRQW